MGPLHPTLIAAASQHVAKLAQGVPMPTSLPIKAPTSMPSSPMRSVTPKAPLSPVAFKGSPGQQVASGTLTGATSGPSMQGKVTPPPMGTPAGMNLVAPARPTVTPSPMPVPR